MKKETFQGHTIQPIKDGEGKYELLIDGKLQMSFAGGPKRPWKFRNPRDCSNAGRSIVDAMEMNR